MNLHGRLVRRRPPAYRPGRPRGRDERGSTTIETIMMVPAFGAFIALIIMAGRVHNARIDVDAAAAQAARTITTSDDPWGAGQAEAAEIARHIAMEGSPTCRTMRIETGPPSDFDDVDDVSGLEAVHVRVHCDVSVSEMTELPVPSTGRATISGEATEVFDEWTEGSG